MKANTIEVRVARRHLRWEVSLNGLTRPMIDWLCTKERAIEHALELARDVAQIEGREVIVTFAPNPVESEFVAREAAAR